MNLDGAVLVLPFVVMLLLPGARVRADVAIAIAGKQLDEVGAKADASSPSRRAPSRPTAVIASGRRPVA